MAKSVYQIENKSVTNQERIEPMPPALDPEQKDEFRLNRAYKCFAFLGVVPILMGFLDLLTRLAAANGREESWGLLVEFAAMILALPVLAGVLYATIYGIRQAMRFGHRPLVFLSAVSILCGGGLLLSIAYRHSPTSAVTNYLASLGFGFGVAAEIFIPAWWFIKGRAHYRSKVGLRD